jgi:hypothetical protein
MKKVFVLLFFAGMIVCTAWGQPNKKVIETPGTIRQDQVGTASVMVPGVAGKVIYQYAVKVVQGEVTPETKPVTIGWGLYFTKVNVHNPWNHVVKFWVKLVLSGPDGNPGPSPSAYFPFKLEADYATEFSQDAFQMIFKEPLPKCFEGFLVIMSKFQLDVVGVYTGSAGPKQLATMYMERVPARELTLKEIPNGLKMDD